MMLSFRSRVLAALGRLEGDVSVVNANTLACNAKLLGLGRDVDLLHGQLGAIGAAFDTLRASQKVLTDAMTALAQQVAALTAKENAMAATLDDLVADVAAETTLAGSIQTLVAGVSAKLTDLAAQLAAAIAAGDPTKVQSVHDAIVAANTSLQASADALTAAVPANVPPTA